MVGDLVGGGVEGGTVGREHLAGDGGDVGGDLGHSGDGVEVGHQAFSQVGVGG